jgi:radical SAM superfamily enzyme YgiQ (UPF0313 family)
MSETAVVVTLKKDSRLAKVDGTRVIFSPHRCFAFDDGREDIECLRILGAHLQSLPGLALFGSGPLLDYLLKHAPAIKPHILSIIPCKEHVRQTQIHGIQVAAPESLPVDVMSVFLCETATFPRMQMRRRLPQTLNIVEPTILGEIAQEVVPARSWTPIGKNIYPIEIPEIKFKKGLDLILLDCPSRNLALMPNGLAYVSNALKNTTVTYQIFDLDIVAYHRFHIYRILDMGGRVVLQSGRVLPEDPWQAEHYDVWTSASEMATSRSGHSDVLEFFRPIIDETIDALVEAEPKILGLSIQQCNEAISREIVRGVKSKLPNVVIVVGGFSCYNADIGRSVFPECDYMCVGEADLTVGLLIEALANGERPRNQPGVLSRHDTPDYRFIPAPMVHNLDQIAFPKYEWSDDLSLYRNYNDYQLTPIIASRGCRWSRCTFCAERFYWRIRSPENFVDELEWLVDRGCHLYMFNESDLGGMPERVMEICDEIIRRGLHRKVKLTGQLRVNKKQGRAFFDRLRAANFVALRFGVDAFSENTLRLQMKGYTVEMISQNLKDCWEAGIFTEVNWVIGVPGETEDDVMEGIDLILKNRKYIGRLANINPLILVNGGVYWIDPKGHNIRFREPKEELYAKYPRALPADSWYSVDPYIDAQVRKDRFERIVMALHDAGFPVGAWATKVIEDVKFARDPNRASVRNDGAETIVSAQDKNGVAMSSQERLAGRDKPASTPPLYRVAGQTPSLIRKLARHDVIYYNGWYFGVPHEHAHVDITDADQTGLAGIVKDTSEEGVIALIEEASYWANTRGQYDAQEKQRASQSYMRVDSALGEIQTEALPTRFRILRLKEEETIAVSQDAIDSAFESNFYGRWRSGWDRRPAPIAPNSALRRLANKLPPAMQYKLRHILRRQSLKEGNFNGGLVTRPDRRILRMLWRGTVDTYFKEPLGGVFTGSEKRKGSTAATSVRIDGQEFTILNVVSKNALPELMWTVEGYNVVKFDGAYFGCPHGVCIDWENDDVGALPGVITARTATEVVNIIENKMSRGNREKVTNPAANSCAGPAGEASQEPVLLESLEGYNIVAYEGWVYGIPHALGPINLGEIDIIEISGVIRDVSRDVVENEIIERVRFRQQAAG